MNTRRQQRDIDKARGHLYGWAEAQPDCNEGIGATLDELVRRTAARLGRPEAAVVAGFHEEPLSTSLRIFRLVDWITGGGENRKRAPLARYVTERGWRESALGKRWLRRLADADLEYRDIVSVEPEQVIRLVPPGRTKPVTVAHEPRHGLRMGRVRRRRLVVNLPYRLSFSPDAAWWTGPVPCRPRLSAATPVGRRSPSRQ